MEHAPIYLIMGPPGAGKGTQAAHIVERYGLRHVATGDLLRQGVAEGTELGLKARSYMDAGDLVPDELIIAMLEALVADLPANEGVLLDGFPRTVAQAEALDGMLARMGRPIDAALDIRVPRDELISRLSARWICSTCQAPYNTTSAPPMQAGICDACGGQLYQRDDDTPDAVANRLDVYERQTAPVSAHYEAAGRLATVDGNQPPADVRGAIDAIIGRRDGVLQQ